MSDVKLELKAGEQLVAESKTSVTVTDARGRVIVLTKPGVLGQYRLVEMLGPAASNSTYLNMLYPVTYVTSIDAEPVSTKSKLQIEALIQRLDDDGVQAVMTGVEENFAKRDAEADKSAIKNS